MPARSYRRSGLCGALGVHPEVHAQLPALTERRERVREQGRTEPSPAPRPAHAEPLDPAEVAVVVGDERARGLLSLPGDQPQVRVEVGVAEQARPPGVERLLALLEVVHEGVVHQLP